MGRLNRPVPTDPDKKVFKSDATTNSRDLSPNLKEDVVRSTKKDYDTIKKGFSSDESPAQSESRRNAPQGNLSQLDAAGRGILRTAGRASRLGTALEGGYAFGRALDEATGLGKDLVNKTSLGKKVDEMVNDRDKVELSQESKDRIARGDLKSKPVSGSMPGLKSKDTSDNTKAGSSPDDDIGAPKESSETAMKRGGKVRSHASKRADGCITKGHTKGRYM